MKQKIPSLTRIFFSFYELIPFNLLNAIFGQHNFFQEPKVALTKELVYHYKMLVYYMLSQLSKSSKRNTFWFWEVSSNVHCSPPWISTWHTFLMDGRTTVTFYPIFFGKSSKQQTTLITCQEPFNAHWTDQKF